MKEPTQEMIERYYDGELSPKEAKKVEAALEARPELRESLAKLEKMNELLCLMNEEALADVSFEGFAERVARGIAQEQRPGVLERFSVWAQEFFEFRRAIWVPSAVVVAAAVALLIAVPFAGGPPEKAPGYGSEPGAFFVTGYEPPVVASSIIESVDFGEATGMQYKVHHGSGVIGVVWVIEQ